MATNTAIIKNVSGETVLFHLRGSETLTIVGNASQSNIAWSNTTFYENVQSAHIRRCIGGSGPAGQWTVARGSNLVIGCAGYFDYNFYSEGIGLEMDGTGTLVCVLNGSANGFIVLELEKDVTILPKV